MNYSLSELTALNHKAVITVPSTQGTSKMASADFTEETVIKVQNRLTKEFGGSTATKGQGTYEANDGSIVGEPVTLVSVNIAELDANAEMVLLVLADYVKQRHQQECVALEVDGKLYFV